MSLGIFEKYRSTNTVRIQAFKPQAIEIDLGVWECFPLSVGVNYLLGFVIHCWWQAAITHSSRSFQSNSKNLLWTVNFWYSGIIVEDFLVVVDGLSRLIIFLWNRLSLYCEQINPLWRESTVCIGHKFLDYQIILLSWQTIGSITKSVQEKLPLPQFRQN